MTESHLVAYELPLTEGVRFERRLFFGLFNTNDKNEGEELRILSVAVAFQPIQ